MLTGKLFNLRGLTEIIQGIGADEGELNLGQSATRLPVRAEECGGDHLGVGGATKSPKRKKLLACALKNVYLGGHSVFLALSRW